MEHGNYILEVCTDSLESAVAAQKGGADRLELCGHLVIGGVTPEEELFLQVRRACQIPIRVLIRPRFGDFCYTEPEFERMLDQISRFQKLGADAVVCGCLLPDGNLDRERMKLLLDRAGHMEMTLHRAFDVCQDAERTLEEAISLGIGTILTSGQADSALNGAELLRSLNQKSRGRIALMAGAGVKPSNLRQLYEKTGLQFYHMSAKCTKESQMKFRRQGIPMGLPGISEYEIWRTDEEQVREAVEILADLP